ncbi:fetal globin inducing factor [Capsaspora owczarzaki ATCC 30864]|uniref:Fetal globin inducing factor n=1 Tax=Capsaspora owczarzaki (strain ATCC 30864) TaxID=595528 RepID=A0A0D2X0J1_CAPO3|nr:fetal globin inducing factor [Capsaspora owczarzaki ATCC 30864]KJE89149.1 fetal globin inducing factor [Capsaspora owczarzaki ATCC 30864]|eukprot:XP_004365550.1 fetal globin inducing factor [Capsaspora owczarzaki ATCC 30864]
MVLAPACLAALEAAEHGRLRELERILLESPETASCADTDGYTPIHRASYNGHIKTIELLLAHKADPTALTNDGWLPLHCAAKWGFAGVVQMLLNLGAGSVNATTHGGQTPLHLAAASGERGYNVIMLLISWPHVQLNARNSQGDTASDIARRHLPYGMTNMLDRLSDS